MRGTEGAKRGIGCLAVVGALLAPLAGALAEPGAELPVSIQRDAAGGWTALVRVPLAPGGEPGTAGSVSCTAVSPAQFGCDAGTLKLGLYTDQGIGISPGFHGTVRNILEKGANRAVWQCSTDPVHLPPFLPVETVHCTFALTGVLFVGEVVAVRGESTETNPPLALPSLGLWRVVASGP